MSFGTASQSPSTIPTFPIEAALFLTLTSCSVCGHAGACAIPQASGTPAKRFCWNCVPQLQRKEALDLVVAINGAPTKPENVTRTRIPLFGASEGPVLPEWYFLQNRCRGRGSGAGKGGAGS